MADGIEQKLNMSLDDLAKKERHEEAKKHRRGGFQRQQGRSNGFDRAGQGHQQRPFREPSQSALYCAPDGSYTVLQPEGLGQVWPGSGMRAQQGWQPGGRSQVGPQRPSVFTRLSEQPQQQYQPYPQQFEPVQQQRTAQYALPKPAAPRQQQQCQQPTQRRPPPQPKPAAPELQCRLDKETGMVIIQHKGTDIVKVGPGGDVTLDSGGDQSPERLAAVNAALSPIHMSVKQVGDTWSVSDGKGLLRFADGVKLPAKGPLTAGRAMVLLQALTAGQSKAAATAAQQASMQAAIAAGIVPREPAAAGPLEEGPEAAQIRRLRAQGRYAPY